MRITPNMTPTWRVLYAVLGLGLIVVPFVAPLAGWMRVVLPIFGVLALVAGGSGW